jgi:signal transduction histidine kinase
MTIAQDARQQAGRPDDAYPEPVPEVGSWRRWLRGHPWQADGLLAAALFTVTAPQLLAGDADAGGRITYVVISALLVATVVARRYYPVAAFTVAAVVAAAQVAVGIEPASSAYVFFLQPNNADLAVLVLLYTLAAYRPRPVSIAGLCFCLVESAVAIARWAPAQGAYSGGAVLGAAIGLGGMTLTAWVLGDSVAYRYRRAYYASVEERAARMEAERDAQARIAAAAERARELEERRARAVDESAARLRRIERDLHDGAQVRLAALAMTLGEVKESLDQDAAGDGNDRIQGLVNAAHANAKQTLAELRDLARGIHPPVLDRGLGAALSALADTSPVPATVGVDISARPSPAIEAIAYFCASELLANVAKHSGASHAAIGVTGQTDALHMTVTDNGAGGAHSAPGGGLAGLQERVQTVDGHLAIDSPPGGPTTIAIELPGHA